MLNFKHSAYDVKNCLPYFPDSIESMYQFNPKRIQIPRNLCAKITN